MLMRPKICAYFICIYLNTAWRDRSAASGQYLDMRYARWGQYLSVLSVCQCVCVCLCVWDDATNPPRYSLWWENANVTCRPRAQFLPSRSLCACTRNVTHLRHTIWTLANIIEAATAPAYYYIIRWSRIEVAAAQACMECIEINLLPHCRYIMRHSSNIWPCLMRLVEGGRAQANRYDECVVKRIR